MKKSKGDEWVETLPNREVGLRATVSSRSPNTSHSILLTYFSRFAAIHSSSIPVTLLSLARPNETFWYTIITATCWTALNRMLGPELVRTNHILH
jgi:hypothetical protein